MTEIDKINDKIFKKALGTPQSAVKFLRKVLPVEIKKRIDFSTIDGGNIMKTLAQELRDEGRRIGIEEGMKEGIKEGMIEGMKEGKRNTAWELLRRGIDMDIIAAATGLAKKELEKLAVTVH